MSIKRTVLSALGVTGVAVGGFFVPPRPGRPSGDGGITFEEKIDLPADLPEGFVRYAHAAFGDPIPSFGTAAIRGRARMKPALRGPWLQCRMATNHLLGRAFAAEFAMTWFGFPTLRSADAFIDGCGIVERFGWKAPPAPEYDQSAAMFMWLEAGMFPQTWHMPGLTFRELDDVTLELGIPDAREPIVWHLDRETGLPSIVEARRFREVGGLEIPWRAELGPFEDYGGMRWWSSAAAIWEDQGRPWLEWTIDEVTPGAPVDRALDRHRTER